MNEYSANLSVIVCAFFEFIIIAYIYGLVSKDIILNVFIYFFVHVGFNKFMEDVRIMLNRRPFEPYWFFTWCISGPIITLVRCVPKFVVKIKSLDCFLFINNPISRTN
jgi:hypothetical protein